MADRDTMFLLLCLLGLSLHAYSFTVTSPGGDTVNLNCSYPNGSSMLWYRRLPDRPPQPLLQTFSPKSSSCTFYIESGGHFTVKENHTLVIHNVSSNDTATYYCARLETDVCRFAEGIDLRVDDQGSRTTHIIFEDVSAVSCHCQILIWVSAISSFLLVVMTSVAIYAMCRLKSKAWQPSRVPQSKENAQKRGFDSETPSTSKELESEYQELTHKHQELYEMCHQPQDLRKMKRGADREHRK